MLALDTSLLEQLVLAVFIFSASIMFLAFALAALRSSREPRESKAITPHVMAVAPRKPSGSVVEEAKTPINPPVNIEEKIREISQTPLSSRSIVLEIELPRIPEKIKLDFDKFRKFMEILREEEHHNFVVQKEAREEEKRSWSALRRHDNPLLDILERVSGLEFSEDGERVYCPRHGWVHYIIASDGRIICGEGHENLWDPNKNRFIPPSKKEMERLQRELMNIRREIEDLQRQAELRPTEAPRKIEKEIGEDYEEEYEEEPGEEETEA